MSTGNTCGKCGAVVPEDAPHGSCPTCLLERLLPLTRGYFGDYELQEEIGRGGMGVVYRARQISLNRPVALKMILSGQFAGEEQLKRFHHEAEAAARLDHPNIIPIYEVGEFDGQPYFSMRLVESGNLAQRIDEDGFSNGNRGMEREVDKTSGPAASSGSKAPHSTFGDRNRLTAALIATIAQAVHYAHQRGILHRDLKPENILFDEHDQPHITDFGLARFLERGDGLTGTNATLGTPAYMAPELASGRARDATVAADVYSLGVILFECLTGQRPFRGETPLETLRAVQDNVPPRPTATRAGISLDLEVISLRCLSKEPERRFSSAGELADELARFLEGRPIRSRPVPALERLWLWCRRKPAIAALAAGLMVVAGTGAFGIVLKQRAAERAREEAAANLAKSRKSEAEARAVLGFLRRDVFKAARPEGQSGGVGWNVTVREALDAAEPGIARAFTNQPMVEAAIRNELGNTYYYLGLYTNAVRQHELSLELRKSHVGLQDPDTLQAMNDLGVAYREAARHAEALATFQEAFMRRKAKLGSLHPDTLQSMNNLAVAFRDAGQRDKALPLLEESLKLTRSIRGETHADTLDAMGNLANVYQTLGRISEATALHETVLQLRKATVVPDHPAALIDMLNLATDYEDAGRRTDAIALKEEVLRLRQAKLGPNHPDTLSAMNTVADSYFKTGRRQEALALHEEAVRLGRDRPGVDHPNTLAAMHRLAYLYHQLGRSGDAFTLTEDTFHRRQRVLGADHPDTLSTMKNLAAAHAGAGKRAEALSLFEELLRRTKSVRGTNHPDTIEAMNDLGKALLINGRTVEALGLQQEAVSLMKLTFGSADPRTLSALENLAKTLLASEKLPEAEAALQEYVAICEKESPNDWTLFKAKSRMGAARAGQKKFPEAETALLQGFEGLKRLQATIPATSRDRYLREAAEQLVRLYHDWGKPEKAAEWREVATDLGQPPSASPKEPVGIH